MNQTNLGMSDIERELDVFLTRLLTEGADAFTLNSDEAGTGVHVRQADGSPMPYGMPSTEVCRHITQLARHGRMDVTADQLQDGGFDLLTNTALVYVQARGRPLNALGHGYMKVTIQPCCHELFVKLKQREL